MLLSLCLENCWVFHATSKNTLGDSATFGGWGSTTLKLTVVLNTAYAIYQRSQRMMMGHVFFLVNAYFQILPMVLLPFPFCHDW